MTSLNVDIGKKDMVYLRRPVGIILENHLMGVSKAKNKAKNSQKLGITAS